MPPLWNCLTNQNQSFFGMNINAGHARTDYWVNTTTIQPRQHHNATYASFDTNAFQGGSSTFANRTSFGVNDTYVESMWESSLNVFDRYVYQLPLLDLGTLPDVQTASHVRESQPGNIAWPMKTFGIVAGALTFGSMIGPMVISHIFTSVARFSVQRRQLFRVVTSILWLG